MTRRVTLGAAPGALGAAKRWLLAAAVLIEACGAPMNTFSRVSDSTSRITTLTWFMITLAAVVFAIVMAVMLLAIGRNRERDPSAVDMGHRGVRPVILAGVVAPALILAAIFVVAETALGKYPEPGAAMTINVTGHQWWWELEYQPARPQDHFRTANELHLPVGRPVRLLLTSADVIHSFWVPQIQGKIDVIPGDTNELRVTVHQSGTYLGACAEFCGAQHANMGIVVVAQDSADFDRWLEAQRSDAATPADSLAAEGQRLFAAGPCSTCHTVRGTPALATVAPDLTHVGSRLAIAAGTLPNTLGNLEAWITNAPSIKPGTKMPAIRVYDGLQLRALAAYVAGLK